jgi:hypothetical protein
MGNRVEIKSENFKCPILCSNPVSHALSGQGGKGYSTQYQNPSFQSIESQKMCFVKFLLKFIKRAEEFVKCLTTFF